MQTPDSSKATAGPSGKEAPLELVKLGVSARQAGDLPAALRLFEAASAAAPENLNILVELANTLRPMLRIDEAEAIYRRVLVRNPNHFGALVGLGVVAKLRGDSLGALAHFEAAAKADPVNLNVQMEIGNTLREVRRLDHAEAAYRRILEQEPRHATAIVGLGYVCRARAQWTAALDHFEAAAAARPGDLNIQLEIAHTLREMCRLDDAESIYRRILEEKPEYLGALLGLGYINRERGQWAVALKHFEAAEALRPGAVNVLLEIGHTLRGLLRFDEAEAIFRQILDEVPNQVGALLGLGLVAGYRADWQAALAYYETAAAVHPDDPRPQLAIASTLRELLRVDEAEAILRRMDGSSDKKTDIELRVRTLEHFCVTMQLDRASEYLASWGGYRNVPVEALTLAASLCAARRQWHDVIDLFRERVVELGGIPKFGDFLWEAVGRASRETGRYTEVLTLIDRMPDAKINAAVLNLRDQLAEEVRLLGSVDLPDPEGGPAQDLTIRNPFRAWRSDLLSRTLHPSSQAEPGANIAHGVGSFQIASGTHPNETIYLCTDRNYLPGAVVTMSSLLRHNMGALRNCSFRVYCSDEILELASAIFGELAAAFSVQIDLRASTSVFPTGSGFRDTWGFFMPGPGLSEAAYYRIYAALQLLNEGAKGRALYVDSDTCVGPHLDHLLEFDLVGCPLGARLELSSLPGIRRAALKLNISHETYFNSGVLLFDLSHPKLGTALRHAIEISLNQKHLLTFHDQCAFNLAFHDMFATLPEVFNLYVRQETEVDALPTNPVIRHFLQRPKPWDPMYSSANCTPWLEEFAALRQVLDSSRLRRLLAVLFPVGPSADSHGSSE
jgi:tetratricopeptide (TPR) repeat protein